MNLICVGINYRSAAIELRESLSFTAGQSSGIRAAIHALPGIVGCVLLSTCNRTEVYVQSDKAELDPDMVISALCADRGIDGQQVKQHFQVYLGAKAVQHLFRVSSGLDSMLLGENQILGQVRDAHAAALAAGCSGPVLNVLFRQALAVAKDIQTRTGISKLPLSLGTLAIEKLEEIHGSDLPKMRALVIGCGTMGKMALRKLHRSGIGRITVTNRTHGTSLDVSRAFDGVEVVAYADRYDLIGDCGIVISATASPHYTVTLAGLAMAGVSPQGKTFIDLAMPRDIDEGLAASPDLNYIGIDQLRQRAEHNSLSRQHEAIQAEGIVAEALAAFQRWHGFQAVLPLVEQVKQAAITETRRRLEPTLNSCLMANQSDRERMEQAIQAAVGSLMKRVLFSIGDGAARETEPNNLTQLMENVLAALSKSPGSPRMDRTG